jgi:hypothetical protein
MDIRPRLRQRADVIVIGNLLSLVSLSPSGELTVVYFINKESNKAWNVDIGDSISDLMELIPRCNMFTDSIPTSRRKHLEIWLLNLLTLNFFDQR